MNNAEQYFLYVTDINGGRPHLRHKGPLHECNTLAASIIARQTEARKQFLVEVEQLKKFVAQNQISKKEARKIHSGLKKHAFLPRNPVRCMVLKVIATFNPNPEQIAKCKQDYLFETPAKGASNDTGKQESGARNRKIRIRKHTPVDSASRVGDNALDDGL